MAGYCWEIAAVTEMTKLAAQVESNIEIYRDGDPEFDLDETMKEIAEYAVMAALDSMHDAVTAEDVENATGHWFRGEKWPNQGEVSGHGRVR